MSDSKSPAEIVDDVRVRLRAAAEELPAESRSEVLDILWMRDDALACIELFKLLEAGTIPLAWEPDISLLWNYSH